MKTWLRKSLVILISILTFGTVTPSHAWWNNNGEITKTERGPSSSETQPNIIVESTLQVEQIDNRAEVINALKLEAERQSMTKFGPKIKSVIENEFRSIILPNIESAIEMTANQFPDDNDLMKLAISEQPTGGISEKIFHIYKIDTGEDVIRFHVRRDKPPLEGYYFNFHYHTYHDQFQTHYTLGTIYWNKNTPPNWKSV